LEIVRGAELTSDCIAAIDTEVRRRLCERSAVRILAASGVTRAMLERKLIARGHRSETAQATSDKWLQTGAIDETRYAEVAVRKELARKPAGRRFLEAKLASRGVSSRDATAVIDAALDGRDELEDALVIARRSVASLSRQLGGAGSDAAVVRRRTEGRLARRGFPGSVVRQAVATAMRERDEP
ncbi:MAG: regulatory protein RecX, partial [Planctomycetota bacterium]